MKSSIRKASLALWFGLLTAAASASEESPTQLETFTMRTMSTRGPLVVDGTGAGKYGGLSRLEIDAFGRHNVFAKEQLKRFDRMHVNGIQVSEGGSFGPKGRQVAVVFSTGYATGQVDKRFVIVYEDHSVEILDSIE